VDCSGLHHDLSEFTKRDVVRQANAIREQIFLREWLRRLSL
jgi:hypothetical protein